MKPQSADRQTPTRIPTDASISRVLRSKQAACRTYDRLSGGYDLLAGASERRGRELGLRLLDVQPGEHALEIGCGTGQALVSLARSVGPTGRVVGLDLSPGMLEIARRRLQRHGLLERVALRQVDAAAAELPGPFDAAFLCFTLELFDTPEIPMVLERVRTSLRGGGRLAVVALSRAGGANMAVRIYEVFHRLLPALFDCRPIYPAAALEQAGFGALDQRRITMWGLPVDIVLASAPGAG